MTISTRLAVRHVRPTAKRIYVVRADGSVDIHPGDTIVVPLDTERLPALTVWSAVTTIMYNLAISAAEIRATLP